MTHHIPVWRPRRVGKRTGVEWEFPDVNPPARVVVTDLREAGLEILSGGAGRTFAGELGLVWVVPYWGEVAPIPVLEFGAEFRRRVKVAARRNVRRSWAKVAAEWLSSRWDTFLSTYALGGPGAVRELARAAAQESGLPPTALAAMLAAGAFAS